MRRGMKMALMLGALVVLVGGYALVNQMENAQEVGETEGVFPLWAEGSDVTSLSWEKDGAEYAFQKGEDGWTREGDASFPVNQTVLESLAERIANLTATRELTDVSERSDYGLSDASFAVTAKDADGGAVTFAVGAQTPFEDGYYISASNSDALYVVESSLESAFDLTLTELAQMESIPQAETVTRLTVGSLDIAYDGESGTWSDAATGEKLDASAAEKLASAANDLGWNELIAVSASDEELAEWQLDEEQATALMIYDGEEAVLSLLLGGEDESGNRYARLADSRMVYTLFSSDVSSLLSASIDTLWNKALETITAEELGTAVFTWEDGELTLTADDAESATAQGILEQLGALEGASRVELGELGQSVLTVRMTDADGEETTVACYAYSVDAYLVPITATHGMLVDAGEVDKLIRMLKQVG
ncbi:MAG: DUF4340 domain-containing protein [Clostridia bacterium]|nr:DUF4340 domain-containing protein [Clostridia bacterium]